MKDMFSLKICRSCPESIINPLYRHDGTTIPVKEWIGCRKFKFFGIEYSETKRIIPEVGFCRPGEFYQEIDMKECPFYLEHTLMKGS